MAQSTPPTQGGDEGTTRARKGTGVFFPPGVYIGAGAPAPTRASPSSSRPNRSRRGSLLIAPTNSSASSSNSSRRHSFGSCPSFPPAPASTAGSTGGTLTPPRSPLLAGMQAAPSPFALPATHSRASYNVPACPLLEGRASFNTATPLLQAATAASMAGPVPQAAAPECFGRLAVSAGVVSGQGFGPVSWPPASFCGDSSNGTSTAMTLGQQYACSSSMLAPAGGLLTGGLSSAAPSLPLSEPPMQLDATESLSNTLLQLQLQLQLQQATTALAAASAPLPATPTPDSSMFASTSLGEQGWVSHCSPYSTSLVSGLAAYFMNEQPSQLHFGSPPPPVDMLQGHQMHLPAAAFGAPSPAAGVMHMPASPPALATAAAVVAGSSDEDTGDLDGLTAALDAQLLLLMAKREELLASRRLSAALNAGLLL